MLRKSFSRYILLCLLILVLIPSMGVLAQDSAPTAQTPALPTSYQMSGFIHIPQHWNNSGPATLTMGLTYFGITADQDPAANWLKPTSEDGNVSPWQMVAYVNEQLGMNIRALTRVGGDMTLLKTLLSNDFPVIIEAGYDPEPERLGWMGHYLLTMGYDDGTQTVKTHDSYLGPNTTYSYGHVEEFWEHFNNAYIVLYKPEREQELMTLLGTNGDATQNALNTLELNRQRALANANDAFAWFNMGSSYVLLGDYDPNAYQYAATAYDQARKIGLPWRMLWYQFGPYIAYNAVGRYQDVIDLAKIQLDEPGTSQYIEETYYYAGMAREGLGETERALVNYNTALEIDKNFTPAQEARDRLAQTVGNTNG
ncbi:MAG: C39 family peptidase [Anaerolineae bacterium]|nr:C39 family peptidase [Anaerolineae bacterium]